MSLISLLLTSQTSLTTKTQLFPNVPLWWRSLIFRRLNLVKYLEKNPLLHVCDSLHNNFIIWSSTSVYAVLLNFETETLKHTNLWVLLSQHLKRLSVLHGCLYLSGRVCQTPLERKANDYDRNMSVVCVWSISVTDTPTYKTYTYFLYFFCAQKSRLYKYFGQQYIENEFLFLYQVQSTSIQQKSFTPFYNVIFITFDIYHKNYTNTAHSHTYHKRNHEPKKQIQTLYIFVNQIITSQLLAALLLLSMLLEKNVWTNIFLTTSLLSGRSKQKILGNSHSQLL